MPWKWSAGVSGICGRDFFDFVISSWGKQWEIFLATIGECCLCRLLTAETRSVRGLSQQPAFMGCRLSTRVCPVHLVDELVLVLCTAFCWCLFFFFGGRAGWWAGEYGFSILGFNAILIYLLFHYFMIY